MRTGTCSGSDAAHKFDDGQRPGVADRLGQSFQTVADHDADVFDTSVLHLGEHLKPELGSLTTVADPQSENVSFAVDCYADGGVDGTVGDLPVADLHHQSVE